LLSVERKKGRGRKQKEKEEIKDKPKKNTDLPFFSSPMQLLAPIFSKESQ
jgi:hypothetical protein